MKKVNHRGSGNQATSDKSKSDKEKSGEPLQNVSIHTEVEARR